jgi:Ni,Fe-hydrogenase I cytochrome b subunit
MADLLHWLAVTQADWLNNTILLLYLFLGGQTVTSKKIGRNIKAVRAVAVAGLFMLTRVILATALMTFPNATGPQVAGVLTNDFFRIAWNGTGFTYLVIYWWQAQWHRTKVLTKRRLILEGKLPGSTSKNLVQEN